MTNTAIRCAANTFCCDITLTRLFIVHLISLETRLPICNVNETNYSKYKMNEAAISSSETGAFSYIII